MESDLTPEQLEIAAEVHRVSVEEMAEFMRPADAPGRMFPPSVIRDMQQSIRDDVQRREWWEKLAGGARVHGRLGTWDVRPPEPVGGTVQGEPWHYEAPKVIRDISAQHHRNLERLSVEGLRAPFAILDEAPDLPEWALRDIAAKLDAEDEAEQASGVQYRKPSSGEWLDLPDLGVIDLGASDDVEPIKLGDLRTEFTATFTEAQPGTLSSFAREQMRELREADRIAELQKIAPNRAERRRLVREERRRGR